MAYNRNEIFQAIGKFIGRFNYLQDVYEDLDVIWDEQIDVLDVSTETRELLNRAADTQEDQRETVKDMKTATKADVTSYITTELREMLGVVKANDVDEVLDALADAMYLQSPPDYVLANVIPPPEEPPAGGPDTKFDIDNGGVGLGYVTDFHAQQTHQDVEFVAEVISVTGTPGEESWSLKCKKTNGVVENLGTFLTGDTFESRKYGKAFRIEEITSIIETNDDSNQLSNWSLTGATKRKGDEEGDKKANGNSSYYGIYYVKLYDLAGTRYVELYRDSARTDKVAEGNRVGDGTINLAAFGGSGLTGSVDVAYTVDDNDIYIIYPFELEVGDRMYYTSEVTTPALFQTFFVEEYDYALPADAVPTVLEAWAQISGL